MASRIAVIALNTYREAVRARLLLGFFAIGVASSVYSLVLATLSLHNELRVIADLGAASLSLYAVVVAIVLGSTSLYRELEHKTIFPILSRPIRRSEYLIGKYFGTVLTVVVFVAFQATFAFMLLGLEAGRGALPLVMALLLPTAALVLGLLRWRFIRTFLVVPWGLCLAVVTWMFALPASGERQLVAAAAVLAVCEAGIVSAVAMLFASFSSPFLTAAFTAMVFFIGRSADTLAHIPPRQFGATASAIGRALARVVPNLHTYVPARPLLLGEIADHPIWPYVAVAACQAVCYAAALVVIGSLAFRKRDFP